MRKILNSIKRAHAFFFGRERCMRKEHALPLYFPREGWERARNARGCGAAVGEKKRPAEALFCPTAAAPAK